jgi:hypothetical protein
VRFPTMFTEGLGADVKAGNEHLRLFSEQNAQGVRAIEFSLPYARPGVYNVNRKSWIATSETFGDIEDGNAKRKFMPRRTRRFAR